MASTDGGADVEAAIAVTLARLERIVPHSAGKADVDVDVIIPVYSDRLETLSCLASVLEAKNDTRFAVMVVEDAAPDPALCADLKQLARRGLVELLVQPENRGFFAAVNTGMGQNPDRDVIWLNADTEVSGDWIDRLRRAAYSAPKVATVTPLTNNGTICSYPRFDTENFEPLEVGWAELDRIAARVNAGRRIETPTCVGFAAYVRRDGLERRDIGRGSLRVRLWRGKRLFAAGGQGRVVQSDRGRRVRAPFGADIVQR